MSSGVFLRGRIPWWARMAAKLVLARLPVPYHCWRTVGLFRHGLMESYEYAEDVFASHYARVAGYLPPTYTALELGPGDSLASAVIARAHGAVRTYLVDTGRFAVENIAPYRALCAHLEAQGKLDGRHRGCETVPDLLEEVGGVYVTGGLASLRSVPPGSVDFAFSHAVLEHVPKADFDSTIEALYSAQSSGGVSSHQVDFKDHLGGELNSLRFSRRIWESGLFVSSGFYTNRLRAGDVVRSFERAGYDVLAVEQERWECMPTPRSSLHAEFAALADEELLVKGLILVVRKPG